MTVIHAEPEVVDDNCRRRIRLNDAGQPIDPWRSRIRCCWMSPAILVSFNEDDCITGELCHADGRPPAECLEVHRSLEGQ